MKGNKEKMLIFNIFIGSLCGWLIGESAMEAEYAYTIVGILILLLYVIQLCLIYS